MGVVAITFGSSASPSVAVVADVSPTPPIQSCQPAAKDLLRLARKRGYLYVLTQTCSPPAIDHDRRGQATFWYCSCGRHLGWLQLKSRMTSSVCAAAVLVMSITLHSIRRRSQRAFLYMNILS